MRRQIERLQADCGKHVTEKVKGSLPAYPYTQTTVKVTGIIRNEPLIAQKTAKLERMNERRNDLLNILVKYLKSIKDEEVREILTLYYIDGLRYCDLAEYMGLEGDGSPLMRKAKDYIKKSCRECRK